jgi:hypothetical protein
VAADSAPRAWATKAPQQAPLFADLSDAELLSYGVPTEWLARFLLYFFRYR